VIGAKFTFFVLDVTTVRVEGEGRVNDDGGPGNNAADAGGEAADQGLQ